MVVIQSDAQHPSEVWSWDITALKGPTKGIWYKCYAILDIYSRYVTGWLVAAAEDAVVAKEFLDDAINRNGVTPHTIHADRGGAMVSKPVSELLVDLRVIRSHSRSRTSNDNPYSEAQPLGSSLPLCVLGGAVEVRQQPQGRSSRTAPRAC